MMDASFVALCFSPVLAGFYFFGGNEVVLMIILFFLPAAAEVSMASGKTPTPDLLKAEEQQTVVGARAPTAVKSPTDMYWQTSASTPKQGWGDRLAL